MRSKLVVGNWKMHGTLKETRKLIFQLAVEWGKSCDGVQVAVCPPFTTLMLAKEELHNSHIQLGAQNCYAESKGAFTGEISPGMLADIGCTYVVLGHSERRTIFGESDDLVSRKSRVAINTGLHAIICIGETRAEREGGVTNEVLSRQIQGSLAGMTVNDVHAITLAYEPVWAIGTGKTATTAQAQEAHAFIRGELRKKLGDAANAVTLLYGGSVKPENAFELFSQPDVDGGLIGGASLDAVSFIDIIEAASRALHQSE